jgi:hypothetical protein
MRREESDPQSLKTTMFLYAPCTVSVNIMTTRVPVTSNYEGVGGYMWPSCDLDGEG